MKPRKHWSLAAKLALVGLPFVLLALIATAATLWVSWQLDGGAAAVNEAGRMRMQAYRLALTAATGEADALAPRLREFETSLALLRHGDPERPLFTPWDDRVQARFNVIEREWAVFSQLLHATLSRDDEAELRARTVAFVSHIDSFVHSIEVHISRWTAILHLLQASLFGLVVLVTIIVLYTGELFVLEPLQRLKEAIGRIRGGSFDARVDQLSTDEFGTVAEGFNDMAGRLQSMYRDLEGRVAAKTAELEEKRERLANLYEISALVARATTTEELSQGFVNSVAHIAHADGAALRWYQPDRKSLLLLASCGLPANLLQSEHCIHPGDCVCGNSDHVLQRKTPRLEPDTDARRSCHRAGFETVFSIPVRLHEEQLGELNLFFHARVLTSEAERSLLEALAAHLAGAMDNLRLKSMETEAAVAQERNLLARELHDSIAQSLAFLKIQVQFMRDALTSNDRNAIAQVLEEIDTGVRESYNDVRELLVHFRTRASAEGIATALATTLRKFEHQSGIAAHLDIQGQALPLSPDVQIQVLHIVQEALSNVRKHARASQVWLDVQQQPDWRIEVRDNGAGFDSDTQPDETHVGLRIMQERAERIGATVDVISSPQHGTSMVLTLPSQVTQPVVAMPAERTTTLP